MAWSSHGCAVPPAYSVPASSPVVISEAGRPSSGTIQGACGQSLLASVTDTTPPPSGAFAASHSQTPWANAASHAPSSSRARSAKSAASGWLPGLRVSGSSAWPNPPSGLR